MDPEPLDDLLQRTLEDRHLSRRERQALGRALAGLHRPAARDEARRRAFEAARSALADPADAAVLDWLEGVVAILHREAAAPRGGGGAPAEAYFSPGRSCPRRVIRLLNEARRRADVCVFTITHDEIAAALVEAHRRGVALRVITDDEKSRDQGSDVGRLRRAGIPVRFDHSRFHMHHKFALFDDATLLTGSYNWTRNASRFNEENFIVTRDPRLVSAFRRIFGELWDRFAPPPDSPPRVEGDQAQA